MVGNELPMEGLGKSKEGGMRCTMEFFLALEPSTLLILPVPLKRCRDINAVSEDLVREVINIGLLHEVLDQMHKKWPKITACNVHAPRRYITKIRICCV